MPGDGWVEDFLETPYRDLRPKQKRRKTPHKKALNDIITTLHKLPGHKKIEVRNVGIGEFEGRKYSFGQEGESDIRITWKPTGWQLPVPISIAIEVKVGKDFQRDSQKRWQHRWEECGGVYWICSNGPEAWDKCMVYWRALIAMGDFTYAAV